MNVWALGGFASVGFLVYFLTQPLGSSGYTSLTYLRNYGDPFIALVVLALLGLAGFAFYMALKLPKK